jgi:hypothetical protein
MDRQIKLFLWIGITLLTVFACGPDLLSGDPSGPTQESKTPVAPTAASGVKINLQLDADEPLPKDMTPLEMAGGFVGCESRWRLEESFDGTVYGEADCESVPTFSYLSFKANDTVVTLTPGVGLHDGSGLLWTFFLKEGQPTLRAGSFSAQSGLRLTIADKDRLPIHRVTGDSGDACEDQTPYLIQTDARRGVIEFTFKEGDSSFDDALFAFGSQQEEGVIITQWGEGFRINFMEPGFYLVTELSVSVGTSHCVLQEMQVFWDESIEGGQDQNVRVQCDRQIKVHGEDPESTAYCSLLVDDGLVRTGRSCTIGEASSACDIVVSYDPEQVHTFAFIEQDRDFDPVDGGYDVELCFDRLESLVYEFSDGTKCFDSHADFYCKKSDQIIDHRPYLVRKPKTLKYADYWEEVDCR